MGLIDIPQRVLVQDSVDVRNRNRLQSVFWFSSPESVLSLDWRCVAKGLMRGLETGEGGFS